MPRTKILPACVVLAVLTACSQTVAPPPPVAPGSDATLPAAAAPALSTEQQQQFKQAKQALEQGDYSSASALLTTLVAALPRAPGIAYNLALAQWQQGDAQQAQQTLAQLIHTGVQHAPSHNLAGVLARQQGHFRQAERHFQRALQADAGYAIAHKNLAFLNELYLGELLQAHYHYQQYYALTQDEQTKVWLALLQQQLEQHDAGN